MGVGERRISTHGTGDADIPRSERSRFAQGTHGRAQGPCSTVGAGLASSYEPGPRTDAPRWSGNTGVDHDAQRSPRRSAQGRSPRRASLASRPLRRPRSARADRDRGGRPGVDHRSRRDSGPRWRAKCTRTGTASRPRPVEPGQRPHGEQPAGERNDRLASERDQRTRLLPRDLDRVLGDAPLRAPRAAV